MNEMKHQKIEVEGDYKKVFAEIKRFAKERAEGGEPSVGPLLMALSGTQRGVYGGGGGIALEELGLRFGFKTAVGVSTGSPGISYFLSGQIKETLSVYWEENTGPEFINLRRGGQGKSAIDITWLVDNVFRKGKKKLDIEALKNNPTDLYYAATNAKTGEGELLEMKKLDDPIEGIRASIAIPEMYVDKVEIVIDGENKTFVDGAVAYPFPVKEILDKVVPTSILVFANRPKKRQDSLLSRFIRKYQSLVVASPLEKAVLEGDQTFDEELYELRNCGIPYTIVWTDDRIKQNETHSKILKQAAEDFRQFVLKLAKE